MSSAPPASLRSSPLTHEQVLQQLALSGLLENCQIMWLPSERGGQESEGTISGRMSLGAHEVRLRVRLPVRFPLCLPEIQLERIHPQVELPHLLTGRKVCFPEDANLLDSDDPYAIAWEALVYARDLLGEMLTVNRAREFAQEAVAYWQGLSQGRSIDCIVSAGEHPYPVLAFYQKEALCAVADDPEVYASSLSTRTLGERTWRNALYLPIGRTEFEQNFHPAELTHLSVLREHVRVLPEEDRYRLRLLLGRQSGRETLLVLGLRRPRGERALLGLHLTDSRGGHPLEDEQAWARCEPIALVRKDFAFLAPRGGAGLGFQERRVLIVGCGSVGGHIALSLARAGVGRLSLVDPDVFTLENTYRHVCGMAWCGHWKVTGLQKEIERTTPYVKVLPYRERIEELLENNPDLLSDQDLVISAIGHPTIELHMNKCIWAHERHPPALFTWLEPLGLGGHALMTHLSRGVEGPAQGCLKCLHQRFVEGGALENRAAFAMPGATYTRDTLGCGSRYMPFADLDSQRTAEMSSRLALRALQGETTQSPLVSWKGERKAFDLAGFSVTPRYDAAPSLLEECSSTYTRRNCPVCGPK